MSRRHAPSIRSRLVLLVLACIVPASLLAVVLISYGYERERDRLVRDSMATARALVQAIDRELTGVRTAAEVLGTSPYLQDGDMSAFYRQAQTVVDRQIGSNVVLSDASGQQLLNTLRAQGEPLPHHGNPTQLREVFEGRRAIVSDLYIGGVVRRPVMSIDVPVFRGDAVAYDLSIGILPERFLKILNDQRLPPRWISAVFDATGTLVARSHEMARFVGAKGAPMLVRRMGEVTEGSVETTSLEGIPVLVVFSRSPVVKWTVAIGIPKKDLTSELWRSFSWFVLGVAILLATGLGMAWTIGGRISRSIRGLTNPALAIGAGETVTVPPLHLREVDEVGRALVSASSMLRQARHQALHDPLTGLANRALFDEIVDQQLAICRRTGTTLSVLYVDLDGFKAINDTLGHATGDRVLCEVGARLKRSIRHSDLAARLGGDEFAVVLLNTGVEAATRTAMQLTDDLLQPYEFDSTSIRMAASVGVAGYPQSGATTEELLHSADASMYQAKAAGGRRVAVAPGSAA